MSQWDFTYVKSKIEVPNGENVFVVNEVMVDTGTTGLIIDEPMIEKPGLRIFGEAEVATLGSTVKCSFADVGGFNVEGVEIGPRRILVCKFPEEVKRRLKSMGFSDGAILGVSPVEDAGYVSNTNKGRLEKVGFLALGISLS